MSTALRHAEALTPVGSELLGGTRESTVSIVVARGLVEAVEQSGVARAEFLREARLEPARLDAPEARMSRAEMHALCELALRRTGDPALGLHWAERLSERTFVPISHLIAHSSSLRQGFEMLAQFFQLLCDEASYRVIERGDEVTVECLHFVGESPEVQRFSAEMMVLGFFRLVRSFDAQGRIARASFAYGAPPYRAEYARLFDGAERFEQPLSGIVFDRALLNAPSPQKDEDVREALEELAQKRLLRITRRTPHSLRVRELLVREGWPHRTDMKSVARALDMSERSLRRRLAEEGTSFQDVLNEALAIVAKHFLRDPRRTIQEVAYEMGFSETSTFHRAFKRWTGTTPSAYREAELGERDRA